MKKLILFTALLFMGGLAFAQTEEKKEVKGPAVQLELPEEASKRGKISKMAATLNGGKEKGTSISSAARKNSLQNSKAINGTGKAEDGNKAFQRIQTTRPARPGRPATMVIPVIPTPPIVRPNVPAPTVPKIPPAGPPTEAPGVGI